jgi:hypothetical protein
VSDDDRPDNADYQAEPAKPKRKPFVLVGESITDEGSSVYADFDVRLKSDVLLVEWQL